MATREKDMIRALRRRVTALVRAEVAHSWRGSQDTTERPKIAHALSVARWNYNETVAEIEARIKEIR